MTIILLVKTGAEMYGNKIYTSDFFVIPRDHDQHMTKVTDWPTYTPHERIICGLDSCFGSWEVGHINLEYGMQLYARFTRKIVSYDAHQDVSNVKHVMIDCIYKVGSTKKRRYVLNYWGYNGGDEACVLLKGKFDIMKEDKKEWKPGVQLSKLPF